MKKLVAFAILLCTILTHLPVTAQSVQTQILRTQNCLGGPLQNWFWYTDIYTDERKAFGLFTSSNGDQTVFGLTDSYHGEWGNTSDTFTIIIMKVDNNGNLLMAKDVGLKGIEKDLTVNQCRDSSGFILTYNLSPNDSAIGYDGNYFYHGAVTKLDNNGNTMWADTSFPSQLYHTKYTNPFTFNESSSLLDSSGNIISIFPHHTRGGYIDNFSFYYINSASGNIIWSRTYTVHQLMGPDSIYLINKVMVSGDHFIMDAGYVIGLNLSDGSILGNIPSGLYGTSILPDQSIFTTRYNGSHVWLEVYDRNFTLKYSTDYTSDINISNSTKVYYSKNSHQALYMGKKNDTLMLIMTDYLTGTQLWKKRIITDSFLYYFKGFQKEKAVFTAEKLTYATPYPIRTQLKVLGVDNNGNEYINKSINTIYANNKIYYPSHVIDQTLDKADTWDISTSYLRFYWRFNDSTLSNSIYAVEDFDSLLQPLHTILTPSEKISQKILNMRLNNKDELLFLLNNDYPTDCLGDPPKLKTKHYTADYNVVAGKIYIDQNNNNIYNAGTDFPCSEGYVLSAKNNASIKSYPDDSGNYINYIDTGSYHTNLIPYNNYFTVTAAVDSVKYTSYGNTHTANFALHPKGNINDLRISLVNTWVTRPGFTNSYDAVYANEGTTVMSNAVVKVLLDSRLTYNSAVPSPIISGDTLKWNLATLNPSQGGKITITFTGKTPPTLNDHDSLVSKAWITPLAGDSTPLDNFYSLTDIAQNSFDPNDKNVESNSAMTLPQVNNGEYITYRVRFQNTGGYVATHVIITDTLASNVDWNTLQIIAASHPPVQTTVKNGNIVEFKFSNINLAPSAQDEAASHGYVVFKVKTKLPITVGTEIKNTAHITFDFNSPVNTNTAVARIVNLTATISHKNSIGEISVYPNPSNGQFVIDFIAKGNFPVELKIYDVLGNEVFRQKQDHSDKSVFNIAGSGLASGMYNISISTDGDSWNRKVMIIK